MVDETDGEFGRHGGQFEEDLVQPKELEVFQSLARTLHVVSCLLSVALAKSGWVRGDLERVDHNPIS